MCACMYLAGSQQHHVEWRRVAEKVEPGSNFYAGWPCIFWQKLHRPGSGLIQMYEVTVVFHLGLEVISMQLQAMH